jgi:hypothetical protein
LLYSWGRRLSANSDSFHPSAVNIARYFDRDRTTVLSALDEMVNAGWAEVNQREPGKPVVYRFIDHDEWAKDRPGCCVVKDTMPWEGEGDPLGKLLYATSGGRAKFLPGQMDGLRKSGFPDEQIVTEFQVFLEWNPQKGPGWNSVYYRFHPHLLRLAKDLREAVAAKDSCNGVSATSNTHQSATGNTPSRLQATPTSQLQATQVVELNFERVSEGEHTIPPPASQERLVASPNFLKIPSEKEQQRLLQKQKVMILKTYGRGSNER